MKKFSFLLMASLLLQSSGFVFVNDAFADTSINTNITGNTTWSPSGNTYIIENAVSISSGVTLTIDPGTIVKFKSTTTSLTAFGNLNALGTANSKIYFTSYADDTVGGDDNNNGTTTPLKGSWSYILTGGANGSTTLSNVEVRYGGGDASFPGQIYNQSRIVNLSNTVSTSSKTAAIYTVGSGATTTASNVTLGNSLKGLYLDNANATILNSSIENNSTYGIETVLGFRNLFVATSTFLNNPNGAAYINYGGSNSRLTNLGNTATGTGLRGFGVYGSMAVSDTWYADDMPYVASSTGVTINSGKTLTIKPGTVVKFANGTSQISVSGTLSAQGSVGNVDDWRAIYFTSIKDDTKAGDTNGDGSSTSPLGNDWKHIQINSGGSATIAFAAIRYGGNSAGSQANLYNNNGTLTLSTTTVQHSYNYGIRNNGGSTICSWDCDISNQYTGFWLEAGTATVTKSWLHDNVFYGTYNSLTSTSTFNAENNNWDAVSGPYHAQYNPSGEGATTTSYVDFIPWLGQSHYIDLNDEWAVDGNKKIQWGGTTQYSDQWYEGIAAWNNLGGVTIEPDDPLFTVKDLNVIDTDEPTERWAGMYDYDFGTADDLYLNETAMEALSEDGKQNAITHELGHALGLEHSYAGNIMLYYVAGQTSFGDQDIYDYDYCWVDNSECPN